MNPEGNYVLAKAVFEQLAMDLPVALRGSVPEGNAARDRCFEILALTELGQFQMQQDISATLRQPPFLNQLDASERRLEQHRLLRELQQVANSAAIERAGQWFTAAIMRSPDDPDLRTEFARTLERHGNYEAAGLQWLTLVRRFPYVAMASRIW